jgi:hypothetical protein
MPINYTLVTVDDTQKDEEKIIEVLTAIMNGGLPNDLMLLNYHKEVPISFRSSIKFIDQGLVEMAVHKLQGIVMGMQRTTLIKSDHLPHALLAQVQRINADSNLAFLNQFCYVTIPSDRRKYVRVQLSGRFDAHFSCNQKSIHGTILDISIGGVAIVAQAANDLEVNTVGMVRMELSGIKAEIPGKLLRISNWNDKRRYAVEFEPGTKYEGLISKLITQQQGEIIRELKEQC